MSVTQRDADILEEVNVFGMYQLGYITPTECSISMMLTFIDLQIHRPLKVHYQAMRRILFKLETATDNQLLLPPNVPNNITPTEFPKSDYYPHQKFSTVITPTKNAYYPQPISLLPPSDVLLPPLDVLLPPVDLPITPNAFPSKISRQQYPSAFSKEILSY